MADNTPDHNPQPTNLGSVLKSDLQSTLSKLGLGEGKRKAEKTLYHFVLIEADAEAVSSEIVLWGDAQWWPQKCSLKFIRKTIGDLKVGTRYEVKIPGIIPFSMEVEVSKLSPDGEMERVLVNGIAEGNEKIAVESRYNGTKVSYYLNYHIQSLLAGLLWKLIWKGIYSHNIKLILGALRDHVEKKIKPQEES